MTREEFEFYLKGCDVTFDNVKKFYEQDALVKCFEDMGAFEQPEYLSKIPEDYAYDTETEDFFVYRHKYTGKEIHIEKPVPTYSFEPCNEAISRTEVLKAINFEDKWLHDANSHNDDTKIAFESMVHRIKALPFVQPKMGRWIMDSYSNVCECSECAYVIDKSRRRAYCPMCGAKMEVEE